RPCLLPRPPRTHPAALPTWPSSTAPGPSSSPDPRPENFCTCSAQRPAESPSLFQECPHLPYEPVAVVALLRAHAFQRLPVIRNGDRKSTRLNSSHVSISYAV